MTVYKTVIQINYILQIYNIFVFIVRCCTLLWEILALYTSNRYMGISIGLHYVSVRVQNICAVSNIYKGGTLVYVAVTKCHKNMGQLCVEAR